MSVELTIEDVAGRARIDVAYVRRLIDLGVVGSEKDRYRERDARVTALLSRDCRPRTSASSLGPVVFQDGDVYGRTVNVASRIADLAEAGDVLTTEETMRRVEDGGIDWALIGPVELQGVAMPVTLFRATRRGDPHHRVTA